MRRTSGKMVAFVLCGLQGMAVTPIGAPQREQSLLLAGLMWHGLETLGQLRST